MNGVVKRKLPPPKKPMVTYGGLEHHLMGSCRIGPRVKLWCSCTWKWDGELPASKERAKFEEHFG